MKVNQALWDFMAARSRLKSQTERVVESTCPACALAVAQLLEAQADALKAAADALASGSHSRCQ